MKEKIKFFAFNFLIPLLLALLGSYLTLRDVYLLENSFLVLTESYSANNYSDFKTSELLKGEKVRGEFIAAENNLGTVAVRFKTFLRINDDFIKFRIKEKGSENWYYQNSYKSDQFQPDQLFPFGFPIITDSKGKTYQFEIESAYGEKGNAVAINPQYPSFVSKYKFSKEEIFGKYTQLFQFLQKKLVNVYSRGEFIVITFLYFLPLYLYILYKIWIIKHLNWILGHYLLSFIPIFFMIIEIFLISESIDLIVLGLTIFWIITISFYKFESRISFVFALLFLIFAATLYSFSQQNLAEKLAVWAYMLLVVGTIQQIWEIKFVPKRQVTLQEFAVQLKKEFRFFALL